MIFYEKTIFSESEHAGQKSKQIKLSDRDRGMSMETTKKIREGNFDVYESILILDRYFP